MNVIINPETGNYEKLLSNNGLEILDKYMIQYKVGGEKKKKKVKAKIVLVLN